MRSKILLVLLNSLSLLCILPPNNIVKLGDAPFMVYVRSSSGIFCGGVILKKDIVLTAAHCLYRQNDTKQEICIEAATIQGRYNNPNKQIRCSKDVSAHKNFSIGVHNIQAFYDIGLIRLDNAFEFNKFVGSIDWINNSSSIDYNKTVTFYGYGYTQSHSKLGSSTLRATNISLIPDSQCETLMQQAVTNNTKQKYEICTSVGPCGGDSGGPLVQDIDGITRLIGIASWLVDDNISCDKGPAVYENISYFSDWILKNIEHIANEV